MNKEAKRKLRQGLENAGWIALYKATRQGLYNLSHPNGTRKVGPSGKGSVQGGAGGRFTKNTPSPYYTVQDTIYSPIIRSRDEAFAEARRKGQQYFWFDGKKYTTELDPNNSSKAGANHTVIEGYYPRIEDRRVYYPKTEDKMIEGEQFFLDNQDATRITNNSENAWRNKKRRISLENIY